MLNVNGLVVSIKPCYKMLRFAPEIWRYAESPYLCSVFFIVLDLRLTKVGARRCSFFYVYIFLILKYWLSSTKQNLSVIQKMRLSQNRVEMASFVSSPIEVIWIFLKKVYKLTFEGFILSNFFFRCHKPPKRLLLQDYVQWPAGRTQFQPS